MSERKVPKIRFPGFTGEWEVKTFGDLYERKIEKNDLSFGTDQIISVANMYYKEEAEIKDPDYLKTYNVFRIGDIAFEGNKSKVFAHGRFVENTIGDGIVSHVFDVFRPIMNLDLNYWKYYINNEMVMGPILLRCTKSSTMMTNLVSSDFLREKVLVPSETEQKQIGSFVYAIDQSIITCEKELNKWKELKKGMLQKMFPKEGKSMPEIRFPGFETAWNIKKLGDIFSQTNITINPKESGIELWSLTVENGLTKKTERYNREFLVKKEDVFKEVRPGDIVYNPMNMTLGAIGYNSMNKSVAVSGYYITMVTNNGYDSYFINTWLKSPQAIQLYKNYATGSLIEKQRVQFSTLSVIPAAFPTYDEQKKIGMFFKRIDSYSELCECELSNWQSLKKALLQQMFV